MKISTGCVLYNLNTAAGYKGTLKGDDHVQCVQEGHTHIQSHFLIQHSSVSLGTTLNNRMPLLISLCLHDTFIFTNILAITQSILNCRTPFSEQIVPNQTPSITLGKHIQNK